MAGILRFLSRMSQSHNPRPSSRFSLHRRIILSPAAPLVATIAVQCQWGILRRVVISKMAGALKGEQGKNGRGAKIRMPTFEILNVVIRFSWIERREEEEGAERDRFVGSLYQEAYKRFSLESKWNVIRRWTLCRATALWRAISCRM